MVPARRDLRLLRAIWQQESTPGRLSEASNGLARLPKVAGNPHRSLGNDGIIAENESGAERMQSDWPTAIPGDPTNPKLK